jgi:hypothetical protein
MSSPAPTRILAACAAALLLALPAVAGEPDARSEPAPPHRCASWTPTRRPLFGDLHVHTALSFDANSLGVRNLPADAYRFARGEELGLQPYKDGRPLRRTRLARPLDFAAVTDHSELLGELHVCRTLGAPGRDSLVCRVQRRWPLLAYIFVSSRMLNSVAPERYSFCGEDGNLCREASIGPWTMIRDAAEGAYDRTDACSFTSLVGYEWSGGPGGNMTHRNVIFADEKAPDLPVSFLDEPTGEGLWKRLGEACDAKGCRFLTIPHNTNLSNGALYDGESSDADDARRRREFEPLMEILQHKGDSECRAGAADEYCSFEKLPFSRMEEQPFPFRWKQPGPLSFAREILADGLVREAALGVNPFRLGMIAATDTHLAAAGLTPEKDYPGHGAGGDTSRVEVPLVPDAIWFNPGGLAGVWAEENSRESIFAALKRREVYATSGPRILVRFFGGYGYPPTMCGNERFAENGYAGGVAMGGELGAPASPGAKPVFAVSAWQDAGTADGPGTPLDRVQVVKIWRSGGEVHEKIFDVAVAGGAAAGSDLDPSTCNAPKTGAPSLCATWTDPEYDPASSALYYARVIEKPSCRWTGHLCAQRRVDCSRPDDVPDEFLFCCDEDVPRTVQERAVTSPIWIPNASGN